MSNTAHKNELSDPIDVEGLDDIYEIGSASQEQTQPEDSAMDKSAQPEGSAMDNALIGMYTVEEAAEKLDISKNAVQKRISRGKLKAKKIDGKFGKVWMIDLSDEPEVVHVDLENTDDNSDRSNTSEPSNTGSASQEQTQPEDSAMDKSAQPEGSASGLAQNEIDIAWQMELLNRVERLSQENGQLKALLGEREKEIKLLTDRQLELSRWQKFVRWFLGG